jgi:hypothetical protein
VDGVALSVDYGTSNTVAVLRWPDGRTRPLLFDGSPLLPSAVLAAADGRILVGKDAEQGVRLDPGRYEPNPKRMVGAGSLLLGDRAYPAVELIAAVLRRVASEATRTAGGDPERVILTCPVTWGATRRQVLEAAATVAGLGRPLLVPEPVAAATYFAGVVGHRVAVGQSVVVYDLGAGTFDVSVVRRTTDGFTTVVSDGLDDFGGVDLDALVVDRVGMAVAALAPQAWQRLRAPATDDDRRSSRLFWEDVRAAKETLSRQPVAALHVPIVGQQVHVTREEFEHAAKPALDRTVRITENALESMGEGWRDQIVGVFLVGGSSRVPLVATLLHQRTGIAPTAIEQPEIVVAEGGLYYSPPVDPGGAPVDAGPPAAPDWPGDAEGQTAPVAASPVLWAGRSPAAPTMVEPAAAPAAKRRGRRRLLITAAIATLLLIGTAVTGLYWYQRKQSRDAATAAFGDATDLRDFAGGFIDEADQCAAAPLPTHGSETGLQVTTINQFRAVMRCTGTGWTGYFYDIGAGNDGINNRGPLFFTARNKADRSASWGLGLPQRPSGAKHPTKIEFTAGVADSTGIYWEPADGHPYQAVLAATILGTDRSKIRKLWQDNAK